MIIWLIVSWMTGIQCCSFEFILSVFQTKTSIFTTDNVELTDHIIMIDQVLGIDIESENALTRFISSNTFLKLHFALGIPRVF